MSDELARLSNGRIHDIISPPPPSVALILLPAAFADGRSLVPGWTVANICAFALSVCLLAGVVPGINRNGPVVFAGAILVAVLTVKVATVLIMAPINCKRPELWSGVHAFLAYPRLYGGILLLLTLIFVGLGGNSSARSTAVATWRLSTDAT